jgi:hypothetical protein
MSEYALRLENGTDTAARVRAGDALALTPNGAVRARGGLRPDGGGAVSVVVGAMQVQCTAFSCWVDASPAGQVGYPFVNDATKTLTVDPGDATLDRVDTVAVVVKENAYDGSGATSAVLTIVKGTPGAGAPAMPTSACIPLRDVNVPAGASTGTGGLSGGDLGSDRRVYTVAAGGVLPVAGATERDALGAVEGQAVYRKDTDVLEVYDGTAWRTYSPDDPAADVIQRNATNVPVVSSSVGTVSVTFATAFASAPTVVATVNGGAGAYYATVQSVTTTGFILVVTQFQGTSATTTVPANWLAVGPLS